MSFHRFALSAMCLLALPALLLAQGASQEARLRVLNGQAISLLARHQGGGDAEKAAARAEAPALFASRREVFDALIDADPAVALRLALPQDVLASIAVAFPNVSASVESRGRWEGKLELITQDGVGWTTTRDFFRLHAAGRTFDVVTTGRASHALKCNDRVAAAGVASGSRIRLRDDSDGGRPRRVFRERRPEYRRHRRQHARLPGH